MQSAWYLFIRPEALNIDIWVHHSPERTRKLGKGHQQSLPPFVLSHRFWSPEGQRALGSKVQSAANKVYCILISTSIHRHRMSKAQEQIFMSKVSHVNALQSLTLLHNLEEACKCMCGWGATLFWNFFENEWLPNSIPWTWGLLYFNYSLHFISRYFNFNTLIAKERQDLSYAFTFLLPLWIWASELQTSCTALFWFESRTMRHSEFHLWRVKIYLPKLLEVSGSGCLKWSVDYMEKHNACCISKGPLYLNKSTVWKVQCGNVCRRWRQIKKKLHCHRKGWIKLDYHINYPSQF